MLIPPDSLDGSGITVVTAMSDDGPVGFTCQSFASLSLDPPLVSFNPARTSTTWPLIREAGNFCINVLFVEQKDISNAFARSGADRFTGVRRPVVCGAFGSTGSGWVHCMGRLHSVG